jgi:23S rRNA G2445 N2-methylase RlmL
MYSVYISTYQGLEPVLEKEIENLGIAQNRIASKKRGVQVIDCSLTEIYRFNYELRTALKVLINLAHFRLNNVQDLKLTHIHI